MLYDIKKLDPTVCLPLKDLYSGYSVFIEWYIITRTSHLEVKLRQTFCWHGGLHDLLQCHTPLKPIPTQTYLQNLQKEIP